MPPLVEGAQATWEECKETASIYREEIRQKSS